MILPDGPERFELLRSQERLAVLPPENKWQLYLEGAEHVIEEAQRIGVLNPYDGPLRFLLDDLDEMMADAPSPKEQKLHEIVDGVIFLDGDPDVEKAHNGLGVEANFTDKGSLQLSCSGVAFVTSEMFKHDQ
jgi:hypothetical protein